MFHVEQQESPGLERAGAFLHVLFFIVIIKPTLVVATHD